MKLMAVMAHPDDAEIWCGGTLTLHAERGDAVRICTLSYSEESTRGREALEGAKRLGLNEPKDFSTCPCLAVLTVACR